MMALDMGGEGGEAASSGKILSTESEWTSVLKGSTSLPDPHKEISAEAAEQEAPESMASDKDT